MTTYAKRLIVEGKYDFHVVRNLLRDHDFHIGHESGEPRHNSDWIALTAEDGIDPLLIIMRNYLRRGELLHLGIVVDADRNVHSRWQQIKQRVQTIGEADFPGAPSPEGIIVTVNRFTQPSLRLGVWFMPDNQNPGFLEHFANQMIPSDDPLWPKATKAVADLPAEQRRFIPEHAGKAELYTWLAWQEKPGKPMGLAVTFQYLRSHAPLAQRFVNWATRLYTP